MNLDSIDNLLPMAEKYFETIDSTIPNSELLLKILHIPGLVPKAVATLRREEWEWNYPLKDDDFKQYLQYACQNADIPLPKKSTELHRWYCLIYYASSAIEGWSCGNLVRASDVIGVEEEFFSPSY